MRLTLAFIAVMSLLEDNHLVLGQSLSRLAPRSPIDISRDYRHEGRIDQRVRMKAHHIMNHALYHTRNVDSGSSSSVDSGSNRQGHAALDKAAAPSVDSTAMVANPAPACDKALAALNGIASNPSGIAVCYNVLMLNVSTGVFQADVRLYKIAPPSGDWATLDNSRGKISTGLQYMGADVHTPSITPNTKRDGALQPDITNTDQVKRAAKPPESVKNLTYIGQAHADVLWHLHNVTIQQALVTPMITISGTIANGSVFTTMLSSADASFVSGLFENSVTGNTTAAAAAAEVAAIENAKFVLPGTSLGIFPTGLIITSAWAFIFICVVGYGTFGRIQFREAYRRRVKRGMVSDFRRI